MPYVADQFTSSPEPVLALAEEPNTSSWQGGGRSHWVHVVSHLDPKYGGLSSAVPALSSAISRTGDASVTLAGFCREGEQFAPAVPNPLTTQYFPVGHLSWWKNRERRSSFEQLIAGADGVHIHGLWQMSTSAAARLARSERKPYVVSAHGMLETWALANKRVKKQLYAAMFERPNLRSSACLHALTRAEARDYRNFGLSNPIAVIPNGVDLPALTSSQPFLERFPNLRGRRLVLFLSRIHFKKGLDLLADSWAKVSEQWPEAHLVLAGPDFEDTRAQVEKRLAELGISERVTFTGMLGKDLKWSALAAADCFVLPSYSEGLSVSVLEAMGLGLPVIITEQCNLPEVAEYGCGWTIQPDRSQLTSALNELLRLPPAARSAIGENGRRLVADRYNWPAIGEQMTAVYGWLQGGPMPGELIFPEGASA